MRTLRVHPDIAHQLTPPSTAGFGVRWWLTAPARGYLRAARWISATPQRLLGLAWIIGMIIVGLAANAAAEDLLKGPDLVGAGPKTLHERFSFIDYSVIFVPDSDHEAGLFSLGNLRYNIISIVCIVLLALGLGLLKGCLVLLEWLLHLTIYQDNADQIDIAVRLIATEVFWPLIMATVAVGAFVSFARWQADGRGFASDLAWILAATCLAFLFVSGPSAVMRGVDGLRQSLGNGVVIGASKYLNTNLPSVTGYPPPEITGDTSAAATRKLVDGLWQAFGARSWCLAMFNDLPTCQRWGHHYLTDDNDWKRLYRVLQGVRVEAGGYILLPRYDVPPEEDIPLLVTVADADYLRGQDERRLIVCLVLLIVCAAFGLLLGRIVVAGLIATAGFLIALIVCVLFLLVWVIPGGLRQVGMRALIYTLGLQLQALFITVILAALMIVAAMFSLLVPKYGILAIAALNISLFLAAMKTQAWLDNTLGIGSGPSLGYASVAAIRAVGSKLTGKNPRLAAVNRWMGRQAGGLAVAGARKALTRTGWTKKPQGLDWSLDPLWDKTKSAWEHARAGTLGQWRWQGSFVNGYPQPQKHARDRTAGLRRYTGTWPQRGLPPGTDRSSGQSAQPEQREPGWPQRNWYEPHDPGMRTRGTGFTSTVGESDSGGSTRWVTRSGKLGPGIGYVPLVHMRPGGPQPRNDQTRKANSNRRTVIPIRFEDLDPS